MTQIGRKPPRQPQRVNEPEAHLRQVGSFPTEAHVTTSLPQRAACRPVPPECACVCVATQGSQAGLLNTLSPPTRTITSSRLQAERQRREGAGKSPGR